MVNFIKDINSKYGKPFVEVENTEEALLANDGKYYLPKAEIEKRFSEGNFHLTFLQESDFTPIEIIEPVFDLEDYKRNLTYSIQEYLDEVAREYDHDSTLEIPLYVNQTYNLNWKEESVKLLNYITLIWMLRDEYFEQLTEETIVNNFTETLPKYNG